MMYRLYTIERREMERALRTTGPDDTIIFAPMWQKADDSARIRREHAFEVGLIGRLLEHGSMILV